MLADSCVKEVLGDDKRPSGGAGKIYALMNISCAAGLLLGPVWADLVIQRSGWFGMCRLASYQSSVGSSRLCVAWVD
jgi:hypothetical protein